MNVVTLIGRMTRDPESTDIKSGGKVCRMGLAVDNAKKDGEPCFIDVVAFGRQAEVCQQYLKKGYLTGIEGRLDFHRWNGADGKQRSSHSVIAQRVVFLEPKKAEAPGPVAEPELAGAAHAA